MISFSRSHVQVHSPAIYWWKRVGPRAPRNFFCPLLLLRQFDDSPSRSRCSSAPHFSRLPSTFNLFLSFTIRTHLNSSFIFFLATCICLYFEIVSLPPAPWSSRSILSSAACRVRRYITRKYPSCLVSSHLASPRNHVSPIWPTKSISPTCLHLTSLQTTRKTPFNGVFAGYAL